MSQVMPLGRRERRLVGRADRDRADGDQHRGAQGVRAHAELADDRRGRRPRRRGGGRLPCARRPVPTARGASRRRPRSACSASSMVFVLLTYGGWNEAAYISAELRGGRRAIVHGADHQPRDHRGDLHRGERWRCCTASASRASPTARPRAPTSWSARSALRGAQARRAVRRDRRADIDQRDDDRRRAHQLRAGPRLVRRCASWADGIAERGTPTSRCSCRERSRSRWSASARCSTTASSRWSNSRRRCSGRSSCSSASRCSCCVRGTGTRSVRSGCRCTRLTPIVFCVACAWLAYSSIIYAASRSAVHVSLIVMAVGVVALLVTRAKRTPTAPAVADD